MIVMCSGLSFWKEDRSFFSSCIEFWIDGGIREGASVNMNSTMMNSMGIIPARVFLDF